MKPPFRADQVGSLLRPAGLTRARSMRTRDLRRGPGKGDPRGGREAGSDRPRSDHRRRVQPRLVAPRLPGAARRRDARAAIRRLAPSSSGTVEQPPVPHVTGKLRYSKPIMVDDFAFLKSVTKKTAKFTIPSPSMLHLRAGRAGISREAYPDLEEFWDDAAKAYRAAIAAFAAAGCTYLQLDDVSFAYLCDPKIRENCRKNGDDPEQAARDLRQDHPASPRRAAAGHDDHDAHLPRQLQERLGRRGRLRAGRREHVRERRRRLLHGVRHRARRRLRAAALRAEGQEGGARPGFSQDRGPGEAKDS